MIRDAQRCAESLFKDGQVVKMNPLSVFHVQTWCVVFPAWQADGGLQVFPAGNGLQWVHFTCGGLFLTFRVFLLKRMQVSVSPCVSVPRDMSCDNLALCLPCPNLSVAYVKDRRLSGGPGTLLPVPVHLWPPTAALFNGMGILVFFLFYFLIKVGHEYNLFFGLF